MSTSGPLWFINYTEKKGKCESSNDVRFKREGESVPQRFRDQIFFYKKTLIAVFISPPTEEVGMDQIGPVKNGFLAQGDVKFVNHSRSKCLPRGNQVAGLWNWSGIHNLWL